MPQTTRFNLQNLGIGNGLLKTFDYTINYGILPIAIIELLYNASFKGGVQFYLCQLFQSKDTAALSTALYNMFSLDPYFEQYGFAAHLAALPKLPIPPWNAQQFAVFDQSVKLNFHQHCNDATYQGQLTLMTTTAYGIIHTIRTHQQLIALTQFFLVLLPLNMVYRASKHMIPQSVLVEIGTPIMEEVLFRGLLQGKVLKLPEKVLHSLNINFNFLSKLLQGARITLQGLMFAAWHFNGQNADMFRFLTGVILGIMYEQTNSIYPSILAHILFNAYVDNFKGTPDANFSLDPNQFKDSYDLSTIATNATCVLLALALKQIADSLLQRYQSQITPEPPKTTLLLDDKLPEDAQKKSELHKKVSLFRFFSRGNQPSIPTQSENKEKQLPTSTPLFQRMGCTVM